MEYENEFDRGYTDHIKGIPYNPHETYWWKNGWEYRNCLIASEAEYRD